MTEQAQFIMLHIEQSATRLLKMEEPIRIDQIETLLTLYPAQAILEVIDSMHNWKPLMRKNVSAYLTCRKWLRLRKQDGKSKVQDLITDLNNVSRNAKYTN